MEEKSRFWANSRRVLSFAKKYAIVLTLIFVLALQFVPNEGGAYPWGSMWIRMQTKELRIADKAAASSVDDFVRSQVSSIASQQYPNLPAANRNKVINDLTQKFKEENKEMIDRERDRLAEDIRDNYTYESDGRKFQYMPDIDPYFYLRYARNILETGKWYDELKDGKPWDNHMRAPLGSNADSNWHSDLLAFLYRVFSVFDEQITLMEASNYFPVIFMFLSLIFAFLIAQKLSGNIGGFFSVTVLGLLPAVMSRTPWGHADTDTYNIFFPLLVVWLLFEALSSESVKRQAIFGSLAGLAVGIYTGFWAGWWYLFDFILAAFVLTVLTQIVINRNKIKEGLVAFWPSVKKFFIVGSSLFAVTLVVGSLNLGFVRFLNDAFMSAIRYTTIKEAALPSLWPNVFTTVAELNPASLSSIVASVGGKIMFAIAIFGILLLLMKRDENGKYDLTYSSLLAIWFIGTIYMATKGLRFTLLLGPAFAVAFGVSAGLLCKKVSEFSYKQFHIKKIFTVVGIFLFLCLIIVNPTKAGVHMTSESFNSVANDVPIMDDAWWNALTEIKDNSEPDAIINSWWDFGHHFKFVADRAVTFDGATQNAPHAHWVGRALQTDNEEEAVSILRMLDCGANSAYELIFKEKKDPLVSVKLVKEIIMVDRESAAKIAEDAGISADVLEFTHCDPPENFFIASGDMIGKAGVWAHFGLWDFERAEVWNKWRKISKSEAVPKMAERFGISEDGATKLYNKASSLASETAANEWISPWPGYVTTDVQSCKVKEDVLDCGKIKVNLKTSKAEVNVPQGTAVAGTAYSYDRSGGFTERINEDGNENLAVAVWPVGDNFRAIAAQNELINSMFTRLYYMEGLGLKYFKPFTSQNHLIGGFVHVYKIDWSGAEVYVPKSLLPKESVEPGAKVVLNYIGWTDDGRVFDSSILNWQSLNVSQDSKFDSFKTSPLSFKFGTDRLVPGFENGILGMKTGDIKTLKIAPEDAYGADPDAHELGNKTLNFKIRIESVQ